MPQASLGLLNLWSINLEVGIENEKRVKSVPQASLGGQSVKCSGRTNEPPEKFTFYFAHAKATPRNAKARHGTGASIKTSQTPPSHPPHPPRPLVLLNTPTFCLKPRQAGTWNPSALNREISGDILKQCNFSILFPPLTSLLSTLFCLTSLSLSGRRKLNSDNVLRDKQSASKGGTKCNRNDNGNKFPLP